MKSILLFTDWFAPAYKAGGPVRSCVNFAQAMSDCHNIFVVTGDKDFGDVDTMSGIIPDKWVNYGVNIEVIYVGKEKLNFRSVKNILKLINPDYVYLNSMFSLRFTFLPLLLNYMHSGNYKVVLAPRGMLHNGAIQFKKRRKAIFLMALRVLNIAKRVYFQGTDAQEKEDIIKWLNIPKNNISVIQNFPKQASSDYYTTNKKEGRLKLVFISRIAPKKNLLFLLTLLSKNYFRGEVQLEVFGPEEEGYWQQCKDVIVNLESNIVVKYHGAVEYKFIEKTIQSSHFFILPTLGENFGHAIFEAFAAGRPVLISDQTPWRSLHDKNIGWDLSLEDKKRWVDTIQEMIDMDDIRFQSMCRDAHSYAKDYVTCSDLKNKYLELFSK